MNRRELIKSLAAVPVMAGGAASPGVSWSKESGSGAEAGQQRCYTDEWKRTEPDYVLYLPPEPLADDGDNEHLVVVETPKGDLLATWSQGAYEMSRDYRTVASRSRDGGVTWTAPETIVGPTDHPGFTAAFAVPLVSRSGRIYLLFNKHTGVTDMSYTITSLQRCIYSDDDGHTWQEGADLEVRRRPRYDHPDPKMQKNLIFWQQSIRDSKDRTLLGFTRWSSLSRFPMANGPAGWYPDSRSEFVRFDNLDDGPHPKDLKLTWLPEGDSVSVPCPFEPHRSRGYSLGEEPAVVLLPDGRLFAAMRTITGNVWYSVSEDSDGRVWRKSEALRIRDQGRFMPHPKNTAPLYRLLDGRYILFFQNHDGTGYGAKGPGDMGARRAPMFYAVGEFQPKAHQPIWFNQPKVFCDAENVAVGPGNGGLEGGRTWLSFYGAMSYAGGKQILWYPDRKHFLLGKEITPQMLG